MARHVVGLASEIPPDTRKLVEIAGRPIIIFNVRGEYFALLNRCPHQGASLCEGLLTGLASSPEPGVYVMTRENEILRCPWHGWEYDIRTGESWFDPLHTKLRIYATDVEPGAELVKGPYVAETFPVSVDEDYLIVQM